MIKSKVENIPVGEVSFLTVIPDINKFISSDDDALDFPLSISQLALAAQTSVHTVRNYVLENLVHCEEKTKSGHSLYGLCALKRLKFIRAARAAGLLVVDIKPLLMAIDAGERKVPEDIQKLLLTKIEHRKVFLNLVTNQIEEFCN